MLFDKGDKIWNVFRYIYFKRQFYYLTTSTFLIIFAFPLFVHVLRKLIVNVAKKNYALPWKKACLRVA